MPLQPVSPNVSEMEGISATGGCLPLLFEDVPLVQFMDLVFTRMSGGVIVEDSGLSLCPLFVKRYYLPFFVDSTVYARISSFEQL